MFNLIKTKLNLQILISYFGTIPFICVLTDIFLFNIFDVALLKDFIFFYILLIFTFIGAKHWNFIDKSNNFKILFGFLPSLLSTFLIIFNLLDYNINFIFIILIFF